MRSLAEQAAGDPGSSHALPGWRSRHFQRASGSPPGICARLLALCLVVAVAALPLRAAAKPAPGDEGDEAAAASAGGTDAEGRGTTAEPAPGDEGDEAAAASAGDTDADGKSAGATTTAAPAPDASSGTGAAEDAAPVEARKVAVVITEAVGVGALADRLAEIAAAALVDEGAAVLEPAAASSQLRAAGGPDPLTCGTDTACLELVAKELNLRWVLAIGLGRLGGMYGLELRLLDVAGARAPRSAAGTWAEPGPDWEKALPELVAELLPEELLAPPAGSLLVRANEPGELYVDGEAVATLPQETPVELPAGAHLLELRGERGSATGQVEIVAGELAEVELILAPALAIGGAPAWVHPTKWIAGGTAVALFGGALATHLSASSTMDDARGQKSAGESFASTRQDALDRLDTSRLLYAAAGAVALGTVGLFLFDDGLFPFAPAAEPPALTAER